MRGLMQDENLTKQRETKATQGMLDGQLIQPFRFRILRSRVESQILYLNFEEVKQCRPSVQ